MGNRITMGHVIHNLPPNLRKGMCDQARELFVASYTAVTPTWFYMIRSRAAKRRTA